MPDLSTLCAQLQSILEDGGRSVVVEVATQDLLRMRVVGVDGGAGVLVVFAKGHQSWLELDSHIVVDGEVMPVRAVARTRGDQIDLPVRGTRDECIHGEVIAVASYLRDRLADVLDGDAAIAAERRQQAADRREG